MKKTIRMNEQELHRLISESVKRVLNEEYDENPYTLYHVTVCYGFSEKFKNYKVKSQEVANKIRDRWENWEFKHHGPVDVRCVEYNTMGSKNKEDWVMIQF